MLHYLPGCDVRKNHPEAINKLQRYMEQNGAMIDTCCRVENTFLNEQDMIVNNCTLCQIVLNETHKDNECLSLYEYILKDSSFNWVDHQGESITIQDCWRTRDDLALQKAVRKCLTKMNFNIVEMKENYDKTKYCGVWLYNPPFKDCLKIAPITFNNIEKNYTHLLSEEKQLDLMQEWVKQYTTNTTVVYCNGCEKGIKMGGRNVKHIVDLLAEGL